MSKKKLHFYSLVKFDIWREYSYYDLILLQCMNRNNKKKSQNQLIVHEIKWLIKELNHELAHKVQGFYSS